MDTESLFEEVKAEKKKQGKKSKRIYQKKQNIQFSV
jgi:hypothetical protein